MSYLCRKCKKKKKIGSHRLHFRDKTCENYPDLGKLARVIQHGLQGFIAKNIEGESTETNILVIFCTSGSVA